MAKFGVTLVLLALCAASAAGQAVNNMMPSDEQLANAEYAVEPAIEELDAVYNELDGVEPKSQEIISLKPTYEEIDAVEAVTLEPAFEEHDAVKSLSEELVAVELVFEETDAEVETSEEGMNEVATRTTTFLTNPTTTRSIAKDVTPTTAKSLSYGKLPQCSQRRFHVVQTTPCQDYVEAILAETCGGVNRIKFINIYFENFKFCPMSCVYNQNTGTWFGSLKPEYSYTFECI